MDLLLRTLNLLFIPLVFFSAILLPYSLKNRDWGALLYLGLNSLLWIGITVLIVWGESIVQEGDDTHILGPACTGTVCYFIGMTLYFTPKEFFKKESKGEDETTRKGTP